MVDMVTPSLFPAKRHFVALIASCGLEDHHISTKCLQCVVDTVFISDQIQHGTAHDAGGKFQHHHVWPVCIAFCRAFVFGGLKAKD